MTDDPDPAEPPWFPLETPRLILREFAAADFDDIHAYAADPEVSRFMTWGPNSPEDTRRVLGLRLEEQKVWPRTSVNLAVALKGTGRLIGAIRLEIQDAARRTADFGHTYHRDVWGRGVATEAARAILDAGFQRLGLHRIWATCDARNLGSRRVLEKLGMLQEGHLRQDRFVRDAWRDTLVFAVLAQDWAGIARSRAA